MEIELFRIQEVFLGYDLPTNTECKVLTIEDRIKLLFSAKQVQIGGKC